MEDVVALSHNKVWRGLNPVVGLVLVEGEGAGNLHGLLPKLRDILHWF